MFFTEITQMKESLFLLDLQFPECNDPGAYLCLQEEKFVRKGREHKESNVES